MSENADAGVRHDASLSLIQKGLYLIAGICVFCAVWSAFAPQKFDDDSAKFLGLAVVALVIDRITKFKGFGIEIEKEVAQLKQEVRSVECAVGTLERNVGPGSKSAVPVASPTAAIVSAGAAFDPEDPNRGQFGGLAEVNGRKLSATIEPIAGPNSSACRVTFRVESTDPARPLSGNVKVYLHPTFGRWASYHIEVRHGIAEDNIESFGAFTIGVQVDEGATRLELDLMNVRGGTDRFYEE